MSTIITCAARAAFVGLLIIASWATRAGAQDRTAGQAVVPAGWENEDSVRFAIFNIAAAKDNAIDYPSHVDSLMDVYEVNWQHQFGPLNSATEVYGKRKGISAAFWDDNAKGFIHLQNLGNTVKQWLYYPSPEPTGIVFQKAPYWRYNDVNIDPQNSRWFNNEYDANDISPYSEYFRRPSFVAQTYTTKTADNADTTVSVGEAGRVVLGFSDNRMAENMLRTFGMYRFTPQWSAGDTICDTARAFTARLEFNLNTGTIDTTNLNGRSINDLTLMRVQIAYKPKDRLPLPFVPFKTVQDESKPGWYIIIDTSITKAIFDSLDDSWRARDTLESGGYNDIGRRFKQLQLVLKNLPDQQARVPIAMDTMVKAYTERESFMEHPKSPITQYQHPDSLVTYGLLDADDSNFVKRNALIEIRVLSTYRSTLRIRSLAWQDEIADKFFYRRRFGDTVHSCNLDGSFGGLDDTLYLQFKRRDSLVTSPQKYMIFNDMDWWFDGFSAPMIALLDHVGSKFGIHSHVRQQEWNGEWSRQLRRERLSHDGVPPAFFENQTTRFNANSYAHHETDQPRGMLVHDYVQRHYTRS